MVEELTLRHRGSRSQQHRQELEGTNRRSGGGDRKPCLPWREGLWVLEIAGQGVGGCGI